MANTKTTIVSCLRRVYTIHLGNFEKHYLQVCPSDLVSTTQVLAPLLKYQLLELQRLLKKVGPVSPAIFSAKMKEYTSAINTEMFEFTRLILNKVNAKCLNHFITKSLIYCLTSVSLCPIIQMTSNIMVSLISDDDVLDVNKIPDIEHPSNETWMEYRDKNVRDYDILGFVVFRAFIWMFQKWLNELTLKLLEKVFLSKGLSRRLCLHEGSFFMIGKRQTCMASGSMAKPANEGTDHDYWNKSTINTNLLPLVMTIINQLGEEAFQMQNSCGELCLNLLRITLKLAGIVIDSAAICIYNILSQHQHSQHCAPELVLALVPIFSALRTSIPSTAHQHQYQH